MTLFPCSSHTGKTELYCLGMDINKTTLKRQDGDYNLVRGKDNLGGGGGTWGLQEIAKFRLLAWKEVHGTHVRVD